ncbi:MAG: radical SAM-associated putative lipoprotein [Paludibacter sp.]|nr:radical SAM-associated putative lipoprotein [Paludibacter sp.]
MNKFIKISTKICGAMLAVLGFSALATSCGTNEPNPAYGMPPNEYIAGKVTDKVTGKPIKGIKVRNWYAGIIPMYGVPSGNYMEQSAFTNENGNYEIFIERVQPHLSFQDVDGEENGLYNDTTVTVDMNNIALTPKN